MVERRRLINPGVLSPAVDPDAERWWMSVVHDVARRIRGRVVSDAESVDVGRSFARVVLRMPDGRDVTVVFNPAANVVACVDGDRPFPGDARFIAVPEPETFAASGFVVADVADLAADLDERDLLGLDRDEVAEIRYHRPRRVGDVLFNWFD